MCRLSTYGVIPIPIPHEIQLKVTERLYFFLHARAYDAYIEGENCSEADPLDPYIKECVDRSQVLWGRAGGLYPMLEQLDPKTYEVPF